MKLGHDLTIVTYGALVQKSLQAAMQLEAAISQPVRRSDRPAKPFSLRLERHCRFGEENQSRDGRPRRHPLLGLRSGNRRAHCRTNCSPYLDAPVGRVAALDTWVAYNPQLENEILPQVEDLVAQGERLLKY